MSFSAGSTTLNDAIIAFMVDSLIDCFGFYVVSAIFQPCNGARQFELLMIKRMMI